MMQTSQDTLILVYYHFKGMGQIARHLLCFLNINFIDIHLQNYEQEKKSCPEHILQKLKGQKIDKNLLPILIDGDITVQQLYPIMTYLCYRFNRQDLLGRDIYQKAKVQQLMEVYINDLPHTQSMLFQFADNIGKVKSENLFSYIYSNFLHVLKQSQYIRQIADYIQRYGNKETIIGTITIVDLYYFQTSNYILGLFGSLHPSLIGENMRKYFQLEGKQINGTQYLDVLIQYQKNMKMIGSYQANMNYLEKYSVLGHLMPIQRRNGFKRVWSFGQSQVQ